MKRALTGFVLWVCLAGSAAWADVVTNQVFDPYFLGFESEPAMDYGGRDIATIHGGLCRATGSILHTDRNPFLAPIYEFVFAAGLSTVQHEAMGHGSRGREFNLDPKYGFGFDFSGYTSLGKDPESNLQNILLTAGGTEGDSVMAHRLLRDLYIGDGADGSSVPLMALAKADFSLYCFLTPDPASNAEDFHDAYTNGNDIAYYLTARQAQRQGGDPSAVWNNDYQIDFSDRNLARNYDDLKAAAIWNLIDPAALAAMYAYVSDHVIDGHTRVKPPVVPFGGGYGMTAGTRAFIGPEEITRFLDLYLVTPGPLVNVYARDLKSSEDTSFGMGAGVYGLPMGKTLQFSLSGDYWQVPDALEGLYDGSGWNACGEVNTLFGERLGFSCKVGAKSDGFFPGTPSDSGVYVGAGLLVAY